MSLCRVDSQGISLNPAEVWPDAKKLIQLKDALLHCMEGLA